MAMHFVQDWRAFRSLTADRRLLIAEAMALIGLIWLGLRIVSFANLPRTLDACSKRVLPGSQMRRRQQSAGRCMRPHGDFPSSAPVWSRPWLLTSCCAGGSTTRRFVSACENPTIAGDRSMATPGLNATASSSSAIWKTCRIL